MQRIYVAGHRGLIGSAILRRLERDSHRSVIVRTRTELDLTQTDAVMRFFAAEKPQVVFLAAGKVGGIVENRDFPADFITQNLRIQMNVMQAACDNGVDKLFFFGSSCMYPRECPQPMAEDSLLTGKPEPTSMAYAIAKLAGVHTCLAYNRQLGQTRFLPLIPNSAYGPNDNFDPKSGHVLSALISRFHEARQTGAQSVTLWGSGSPRREFIHADDIADACLHLLTSDVSKLEFPLNVGVGTDISIRELAETIAAVVGFTGKLDWDTGKPDGAPRKFLDSARLLASGWRPKIRFGDGLRSTYEWYVRNRAKNA